MEKTLPKPINKINEDKIRENTMNLVVYGRKEEKGVKKSGLFTHLTMSSRTHKEGPDTIFLSAERM